ncbi:GNAT family N-acetyltransferase [Alteromonas sp. ASW11-36]|uniref:GNAT family N-acetyltransferase n=1 Tax=Alteromonas arenosi TaxID=3055817 RepID=A0ABT7SVE4_9ALTE|nr:GNAT family N-acetyltransferase [Alteromonas sp. ASW11-36]MDM7860148.1 GNAT family N-acetyltransferase [Alteromonas sp. ASW11-36]
MTIPTLHGYQISLRPVVRGDIEQLRIWRNSEHVKQFMLSDNDITKEQQLAWFEHIQRAHNQWHFVIEYRHQAIGSCNIKTRGKAADISTAKHFELGLYIGEQRYLGNIIAFAPTLLMADYCFSELQAKQLYAVVKPENAAALRYNEKLGYAVVHRGDIIEMWLRQSDYEVHSKPLKSLLNRPTRR